MRLFVVFGLASAAAATTPLERRFSSPELPQYAPEVTVVQPNNSYIVKLECLGCPFALFESQRNVTWQQPPQDNSLLLKFDIHGAGSSLLLNGQRILPLDPMPLNINALQVPTDLQQSLVTDLFKEDLNPNPPFLMRLPLQYEHSLLHAEEGKQPWIQFDVKGLAFGETVAPVKLDQNGQKMVQILLGNHENSTSLFIKDVQVVERKDRTQPFRMKCGKLSILQTLYDPNEWDEFGKLGTWSRTWSLVISRIEIAWSDNLQNNLILIPLALVLAFSVVMARRWYHQRHQGRNMSEEEVEIALLASYYDDAPPEYANIPVIKIEEYD